MTSTQSVGQLQPAQHIHSASYSPELFLLHKSFSLHPWPAAWYTQSSRVCLAVWATSSDAGGEISWIPSFRWKSGVNPLISHSESGPVLSVSVLFCCTPTVSLNFKVESHSHQPLQSSFWTPKSMHCAPRGMWLQVLCIARMSFLNENPEKKKKNLEESNQPSKHRKEECREWTHQYQSPGSCLLATRQSHW